MTSYVHSGTEAARAMTCERMHVPHGLPASLEQQGKERGQDEREQTDHFWG